MTCATSDKNTNFDISKNLLHKVGTSKLILYAVEQFNSLFSKDKLKARGTHTPTHDPRSPSMWWENGSAVPSQQLPHGLELCRAGA